MNSNSVVISVTIIACLLIIGVPTFYKVVESNHDKLYTVTNKEIIEAAEKCYYEKACDSKTVTLNELYEKGYLKEEIIDPVSKVVYSKESYVTISKKSTFTQV